MVKLSLFGVCIIGSIFAHFVPVDSKLAVRKDKNAIPSLSCVLFNHFGCSTECTIVHGYSGDEVVGSCDLTNYHCNCKLKGNDADFISELISNKSLSGSKKVGESRGMNPDLYKRVRDYVVDKLDEIFDDDDIPADDIVDYAGDYVDNLVKFLKNSKANPKAQYLYHQIRLCPNSNLHDQLDKFFKKNGVKEKDLRSPLDYLLIPNVLTGIIIDELIIRREPGYANQESKESGWDSN